MAKAKKRKSHVVPQRTGRRALGKALADIDDLLEHRQYAEAMAELHRLAVHHPREPEVFIRLFNTAAGVNDDRTLLSAALRLVELRPDDPTIALNLAGAYMGNVFPALAMATFRDFLARWPEHPRAADVRETMAELEPKMEAEWASTNPPPEQAERLAVLHERVQVAMHEGKYAEARRLAAQVSAHMPRFAAPLNNVSLTYFIEGRLDEAIATAQRVLAECDPDNFHALSNLVHYLCLLGRLDEARAFAERLKPLQSQRVDVWIKKAEAFSYLGDDAEVLKIFEQAEQAGMLEPALAEPFLIHLAAAAAARLGNEAEAVRLWKRTLELSPAFAPARENVDDLKRPAGERNGPWAIPLSGWLPQAYIEKLMAWMEPAVHQQNEKPVERAARRFLQECPAMDSLTPILLNRGDPPSVRFALTLARIAETPHMQAALKDFAFGQHGTDKQRMEAGYALAEAGQVPRGKPVRMWVRGEWTEVLLMAHEISGEPKGHLPDRAHRLLGKALIALNQERYDEAERLLQKALTYAPEEPALLQNLATLYGRRGEVERAEALMRQIVERHPDYIIGRCNLAQLAVQRGHYDEADKWLEPVMEQTRLHFSEFEAICQAHINLELARGRRDAARSWLNMWASAQPDHPMLDYWRDQIEPRSRADRFPFVRPRSR